MVENLPGALSLLPPDYTPEEKEIVMCTVINLYRKLPDPKDKFIVAWCYELGYQKQHVGPALGMSEVAVFKRIKKIKKILFESLSKENRFRADKLKV